MTLDQKDFANDFKVEGDWVADMHAMHAKFGVPEALAKLDDDKLRTFLKFRIDFLQEELNELKATMEEDYKNPGSRADDAVDALVDLTVISIGTLDLFQVDAYEAWARVLEKNLEKEVGRKPNRPNPLNLPDLIKPKNWVAPTHSDNVGLLSRVFK